MTEVITSIVVYRAGVERAAQERSAYLRGLIESFEGASDQHSLGVVAGLKIGQRYLTELMRLARPLSLVRACEIIAFELSTIDFDEWEAITKIARGDCMVRGCESSVLENNWTPDSGPETRLCHDHLIEILEDEKGDRQFELARESR